MAGLVRNQVDNDVRPVNTLVPDEINDIPGFINGPRPIGPSKRYPCTPPSQVLHSMYPNPPSQPPQQKSTLTTLPPDMSRIRLPSRAYAYVMHCRGVAQGKEQPHCGDYLVMTLLLLLMVFGQYWALALIFFFAALAHNGLL